MGEFCAIINGTFMAQNETKSELVLTPISFFFYTADVRWHLQGISEQSDRPSSPDHRTDGILGWVSDCSGGKRIDAWTLRDRFLRLGCTDSHLLLDFLNAVGLWMPGKPTIIWGIGPSLELKYPPPPLTGTYRISEFWQWQDICRELLTNPSHFWKSTYPVLGDDKRDILNELTLTIRLFPRDRSLKASTIVAGALSSIIVSIYLDLVRHHKFRKCARHDCSAIFQVQSTHKRMYCTQYCGHIESVRRSRRKK